MEILTPRSSPGSASPPSADTAGVWRSQGWRLTPHGLWQTRAPSRFPAVWAAASDSQDAPADGRDSGCEPCPLLDPSVSLPWKGGSAPNANRARRSRRPSQEAKLRTSLWLWRQGLNPGDSRVCSSPRAYRRGRVTAMKRKCRVVPQRSSARQSLKTRTARHLIT